MADLTPSNYQIDWSCLIRPQEKIGIDSFPVASNTALDLMLNYTEGLDFQGGGDAILHNESKSNEAKARTFQDLASLGHTRKSIEVNQFLVCLRDKDDVVQKGKGFTPEEEALPFFLAKSTCDVPEGCHPTTVVEIIYWRQTEGNPNKHFIEGQFINPRTLWEVVHMFGQEVLDGTRCSMWILGSRKTLDEAEPLINKR
jgi:hypothetical protein